MALAIPIITGTVALHRVTEISNLISVGGDLKKEVLHLAVEPLGLLWSL
jgi:hypothetical protein